MNRKVWIVSVISTVAALLLASMAVAFAAQNGGGKGQEKMAVCHKGHTLTVPAPALSAHERHGDTAGDCPENAGTPDEPEDTTPDEPEGTTPDTPAEGQYGQEKVTICHKGHTITVGAPALAAHERHGDVEGACATEEGAGDGAADDPAVDVPEDAAQAQAVSNSARGKDLYGDSAANRLRGTTHADFLQGGRGSDLMFGDVGNDYLDGVDGTSGNDVIDGGRGIDHCVGDEGDTFRYCDGNVVEVPSGTPSSHLTVH